MARMIFCNIGWMSRYQGISHQPDKIVGGGRYPRDNGMGGEVCNFLGCDDGQVYGHVSQSVGRWIGRSALRTGEALAIP